MQNMSSLRSVNSPRKGEVSCRVAYLGLLAACSLVADTLQRLRFTESIQRRKSCMEAYADSR